MAPVKKILPWPRGTISRADSRPGDEAGTAGHFPHLSKHALGGVQDREIDVGADIEDADFQRRVPVGVGEEGGGFVLLARIERAAEDGAAGSLDFLHQRLELFAVAAAGEHGESFGREFFCDLGADVVAGADHGAGGVSLLHVLLSSVIPRRGVIRRVSKMSLWGRWFDAAHARLLTMTESRSFPRNHFLDFAQLLLAEEHLLADEKRRRAERAALDGRLRVLDQPGLDVGILRAGEQFCGIEARTMTAPSPPLPGSSIFFGSTHM